MRKINAKPQNEVHTAYNFDEKKIRLGKSGNLRLWLTAKGGRVSAVSGKLTQRLAKTRSEMIDEKNIFTLLGKKKLDFAVTNTATVFSENEQIFPVVFFVVGYFAVFGHYWMV